MKGLGLRKHVLSICATAALLPACGESQATVGAPGVMPQSHALPAPGSSDRNVPKHPTTGALFYATQRLNSGWNVVVLTPQGQLVGTITKINEPWWGPCSDPSGDVWVPTFLASYEFAHGGTVPIKTISTPDFYASACAVDSTTHDLALLGLKEVSDEEEPFLAIWKSGTGNGTYYPLSFSPLFAGYDKSGNLFIDGNTNSQPLVLAELPKGASQVQTITVNIPSVTYAGPVLWNGKYLTVGIYDESASSNQQNAIYRVKVSGSEGTVVGESYFNNFTACCIGYWFYKKYVVGATGSENAIGTWSYPKGGDPVQTISGYDPGGITVSR
jgi:hypothetical protein